MGRAGDWCSAQYLSNNDWKVLQGDENKDSLQITWLALPPVIMILLTKIKYIYVMLYAPVVTLKRKKTYV